MSEAPVRDRRAERHQATRDEILATAWNVARADGLAALSLRDLASRVGMRAPSLYSYFPSKHAIYDAMFAQAAKQFLDDATNQPRTGDVLTDITNGLRSFVDFCAADPTRYQLLFQRPIPGFEPSAETYAIAVDTLELTRRQLHAVGLTDPQDLDLLTAIGTGLAAQQISNDPGGDRWARLVDQAAAMFVAHHTSRRNGSKNRGRP